MAVKALLIGGAESIWKDVQDSEAILGDRWWDIVVACNDIGTIWPHKLDAWCTLHPEKMHRWVAARAKNDHPPAGRVYTKAGRKQKSITHEVHHRFGGGSSGLLTVSVALDMEAYKIVLAGIPMTKTEYFPDSPEHPRGRVFNSAHAHWKKWRAHAEKIAPYVRSMSGRTRNLFGAPTPEWLNDTSEEAE